MHLRDFNERGVEVLSTNTGPEDTIPQKEPNYITKDEGANENSDAPRRFKRTTSQWKASEFPEERIHQLFKEAAGKVFQGKPPATQENTTTTPGGSEPAKKYRLIAPETPLSNAQEPNQQVLLQTIPTIENDPILLWPQPIVFKLGYHTLAPRCPLCKRLFATHEFLIQHMVQHAITEGITRELTIKDSPRAPSPKKVQPLRQPIKCRNCSQSFDSLDDLTRHLLTHEEEF